MEEEALRADRGRADASPTQTSPPPPPPPPPRHRLQGEGAALRQHEDRGLRGAQGEVRVLHGGDVRGPRDRLQVPAGRGLERGDHAPDGPVQEPPGDPGREVQPAEAAAAADGLLAEDAPKRAVGRVRPRGASPECARSRDAPAWKRVAGARSSRASVRCHLVHLDARADALHALKDITAELSSYTRREYHLGDCRRGWPGQVVTLRFIV